MSNKQCPAQSKITPHQLRHSCATLLPNAGAPALSVQSLLGHERLDTTLGYARLYDGTIAADYYRAMSQIEKRLDLLGSQEEVTAPIGKDERAQLLMLTTQLEQPELNLDARLSIVSQMREVLLGEAASQDIFKTPSFAILETISV